jgi:hypothetical protein
MRFPFQDEMFAVYFFRRLHEETFNNTSDNRDVIAYLGSCSDTNTYTFYKLVYTCTQIDTMVVCLEFDLLFVCVCVCVFFFSSSCFVFHFPRIFEWLDREQQVLGRGQEI